MQTAVQYAVEKLEKFIPAGNQLAIRLILDETLKMEKEYIMEARNNGIESTLKGYTISNEEYYNQTYNK